MPLNEEQAYLVALELQRAIAGLDEVYTNRVRYDVDVQLVDFYQCVYEELEELTHEK